MLKTQNIGNRGHYSFVYVKLAVGGTPGSKKFELLLYCEVLASSYIVFIPSCETSENLLLSDLKWRENTCAWEVGTI